MPNSDIQQKVDILLGFGRLPKIIIFGIATPNFKDIFSLLFLFLTNATVWLTYCGKLIIFTLKTVFFLILTLVFFQHFFFSKKHFFLIEHDLKKKNTIYICVGTILQFCSLHKEMKIWYNENDKTRKKEWKKKSLLFFFKILNK